MHCLVPECDHTNLLTHRTTSQSQLGDSDIDSCPKLARSLLLEICIWTSESADDDRVLLEAKVWRNVAGTFQRMWGPGVFSESWKSASLCIL